MLRISKHRDTTVSDKEVELENGTRYRESGLVLRHEAVISCVLVPRIKPRLEREPIN